MRAHAAPCKPKGSGRSRAVPLLWILPLLVAVFFAAAPVVRCLVAADVTGKGQGPRIFRTLALPVEEGETVSLRFTHSLNLSDVTDNIEATGGRLVCRSTLFHTYGAGIPDLPDGIGTALTKTGEGYLLTGVDKAETEIRVLLQPLPDHRLLYRGAEIPLVPRFGAGTVLSLRRFSR